MIFRQIAISILLMLTILPCFSMEENNGWEIIEENLDDWVKEIQKIERTELLEAKSETSPILYAVCGMEVKKGKKRKKNTVKIPSIEDAKSIRCKTCAKAHKQTLFYKPDENRSSNIIKHICSNHVLYGECLLCEKKIDGSVEKHAQIHYDNFEQGFELDLLQSCALDPEIKKKKLR